jgi:hypothetical protein
MDIKGGWHMKKILIRTSLVLVLILGFVSTAAAIPIYGALSFSGKDTTDGTSLADATKFLTFSEVRANGAGTGSFSGIADLTAITVNPFTFSPFSGTPTLWTVTTGGITYSIQMTSLTIGLPRSENLLSLTGTGIASISGGVYDPTPGVWFLTANAGGGTASFSSTSIVPEPLTLILFGTGLLGLFGLRRKLS